MAEQPDFKSEGSGSTPDSGSTHDESVRSFTEYVRYLKRKPMVNKTRRGFLKSLGASAGAVAAVAAPAAPRVEEEVIKTTRYKHELKKVDHFLTKGDGTQEGDLAMLKVDGHYQAHVLRNGKWRRQFAD